VLSLSLAEELARHAELCPVQGAILHHWEATA